MSTDPTIPPVYLVSNVTLRSDVLILGDPGATIMPFVPAGGAPENTRCFTITGDNVELRSLRFVGGRMLRQGTDGGDAQVSVELRQISARTGLSLKTGTVKVLAGGSGYAGNFTYTVTDRHDPMRPFGTIDFTVVNGAITAGVVSVPGEGYSEDINNTGVPKLIVGRPLPLYFCYVEPALAGSTVGPAGVRFDNCLFKYGRNAISVHYATDVRVTNCRFEDQGADGAPINVFGVKRGSIIGNTILRPVGIANDKDCIRVTTDSLGAADVGDEIVIAHNICEGATMGGGIVTQVANLRRLLVLGNVCKDNAQKQIDIKAGEDSALAGERRGLTNIVVAGNICTTSVTSQSDIGGEANSGNPLLVLENNNNARYDIEVKNNVLAYDLADNNFGSNSAIRLSAATGVTVAGNVIRRANIGIRLVNNCRNIALFGNDIEARVGISAPFDSASFGLHRLWSSGNCIRATETGIDIQVGTQIRIVDEDINLFGRSIASVAVPAGSGGSGYLGGGNGTFELLAGGSGEGAMIVATVGQVGIEPRAIASTRVGAAGFGYLAANPGTLTIPVDNGGGMMATLSATVVTSSPPVYSGSITGNPAVAASGSGYLPGATLATFAVQMPERAHLTATVSAGVITAVAVGNGGRGFLSTPLLDDRLGMRSGGTAASFSVNMGSPTGIRLANVSAAEARRCTVNADSTGIDLAGDLHDVEIMDNSITTQAGQPIRYGGGGANLRIRGNGKRRADGAKFLPMIIASDKVQVIDHDMRIDTEADAATDTLVMLDGGGEGHVVTLRSVNGNRKPTIVSTGNIRLKPTAATFQLNDPNDSLTLRHDGTNWIEVSRFSYA